MALHQSIIEKMYEMRDSGRTLLEISNYLGIGLTTVQRYCANRKAKFSTLNGNLVTQVTVDNPDLETPVVDHTKKEEAKEIRGVIQGRNHSNYNTVHHFVPDYNMEIKADPIIVTYQFANVIFTLDIAQKMVSFNNLGDHIKDCIPMNEIEDLSEFAKTLVGICETIKKYGFKIPVCGK